MVVGSLAFRLVAVAFVALAFAPAASAAEIDTLGVFRDWNAYRTVANGNRLCYMVGEPKRDEGNYTRRGKIYAFVTHRPAAKRVDEVSFDAGYTYKQGSEIGVKIDAKSFTLTPRENTAWATDDKAMIAAMKAGTTMVVRGVSARGTKTKDTYSLLGFTAAYNAIGRACGLR
jgi:hypothetical protein